MNVGGTSEYSILAKGNGSGGYSLVIYNSAGPNAVLDPLTPSGNTVILAAPLVVGPMQLTAYRFALAGNELQLDLTLARGGSFDDQIVMQSQDSVSYSSPWNVGQGEWRSSTAAGNTCNGTNIQGSILMGTGSWQCWTASQLGPASAPVFGNPFWNGHSGDGNSSGIGWLLAGGGGENTIPAPPGALGWLAVPLRQPPSSPRPR